MHYIGVAIAAFSLVPYLFVKQIPPDQATEEEMKSVEMKNKKKKADDVPVGAKGAAAETVDCEKGNMQPRHVSEDTLTSTQSSDLQISPSGTQHSRKNAPQRGGFFFRHAYERTLL